MFFKKKNEYNNYEKYKMGTLFKISIKDYLVPHILLFLAILQIKKILEFVCLIKVEHFLKK